ncbi:hypothetical protein BGZ65_003907 [Modicella reniformis]|uniref:Uncharacterized protein n=1 Tax=Modicella reniformis TaxID=1440133 RepID=A0A9P6MBV3_9FUNG|nr:hypothetical protein BGZ65_003907 [Modicella reniformis]
MSNQKYTGSSESEASDVEERNHSRTSTSSLEEDQVNKQNGHAQANGHESAGFITRTLNSYKYSRIALDTAGSAVETVNKYTEPYQKRLQPHLQPTISKVDQLAVRSLDLVQDKFPIVTKPTSEIVTTVKKPISYVEESSKSAYTQIQTTIDTRVTAPVKSVTSSIASTASSTANKVTSTATSTANNIASKVNVHATPLVDGLEAAVGRYLPADADSDSEDAPQTNQVTRVAGIGRAVSRRVGRRVGGAVAPVTQSAKELRTRAEQNTVVVKSKDQLNALNTHLTTLLDSLQKHSKELSDNVQKVPREASHRVHTHITELSAKVVTELDTLTKYLKEHSPSLPDPVQARIQPLVTFVNERYVVAKDEWSKKNLSAIQKARNILHLTTEETLPILRGVVLDVKSALDKYQGKAQETIQKGYLKVQEVQSSANLAVASAYHAVHVILVGK